jgi:hypothetical protein
MARIVTVYAGWRSGFDLVDMSYIRWLKISEALARLGHKVDIATNETRNQGIIQVGENLRRVPLSQVVWGDYDVVKTLFHLGFETLREHGGAGHPFIISKLGSVVGKSDMEGIYFFGAVRERLYRTQEEIDAASRYVTVLSQPAKRLWEDCFGGKGNVLVVPGAVERDIPGRKRDPYPEDGTVRCLFAGNIYDDAYQPEANRVLVGKLNRLGEILKGREARLYVIGEGEHSHLDGRYVTHLGAIPYEDTWDYLYHANVGIVVSAGEFMHNNESTKIYHYLRAGLPIVSESGFPNDNVVLESRLGYVVENGDMESMAQRVMETAAGQWDRKYAIDYILENHTWDSRARIYDEIIRGAQRP